MDKTLINNEKHWLEKNVEQKIRWPWAGKVEEKKNRQIYIPEKRNILSFVKKLHCIFLLFDIMSYSAFIIFDIICSQHFFTLWHYVPFGVYYIRHYFQWHFLLFDILSRSAFITFVLMSFCYYLPFNILYFQCFFCRPFVPLDVLSIDVFTVSVFYFNILLWIHFGSQKVTF